TSRTSSASPSTPSTNGAPKATARPAAGWASTCGTALRTSCSGWPSRSRRRWPDADPAHGHPDRTHPRRCRAGPGAHRAPGQRHLPQPRRHRAGPALPGRRPTTGAEGGALMPRPPLPLGTHGKIRVYKLGPRRVRARTNYRDYDGVTRPVERIGRSKADAENRLKEALRDRTRAGSSEEITSRSKVAAVAALWLRDLQESDKALRTKETYRQAWERDLASAVGNLQVGEVTVGIADRVLRAIRDNTGLGSAKHARVVLTG